MLEITTTEAGKRYIRQAKARGLRLHEDGAVRMSDGRATVRDGEHIHHASGQGCTCSTAEERRGHACGHMWGWHFAVETETVQETAA